MTTNSSNRSQRATAPADFAWVKDRVCAYLQHCGLQDHETRERLARYAAQRACTADRTRPAVETLCRALDLLGARMDGDLARTAGISRERDASALAAVRAALSLSAEPAGAESSPLAAQARGDQVAALVGLLPAATPPAAPLAMPAQPLRFIFFPSAAPAKRQP